LLRCCLVDDNRYNATDKPFKQTCFPQYAVPDALTRYSEVADALALGGSTKEEKVGHMLLSCSFGLCRPHHGFTPINK